MVHAFLLTAQNASPGGSISDFCEPPHAASTPQESISNSSAPSPLIASTTRIVSLSLIKPAIDFTSYTVAVDVSHSCINTAFVSGYLLRAPSMTEGSGRVPQSMSTGTTLTPYAWQISANLSPNLPPRTTTAVSPWHSVFTTLASLAPVPLAVNVNTLHEVLNTFFRSSFTFFTISRYCGVR